MNLDIPTAKGTLHVEIAGTGAPVLLWHSLLCNHQMWRKQVPMLAAHYQVVNLDMRGHGQSSLYSFPYDYWELSRDVGRVLDYLDIEQVAMVGLSMGGIAAYHFALEQFHQIPIKPAIAAFGQMLEGVFAETEPGVAEENIQARSRGITLMALSNKFDYLLLSSGNKSEVAVGYVTLYGDTNGGLAVLSDVFKTCVYQLAHHINERAGRAIIPESTITKPPSAELKPGQQDSDSLPPYEILDAILERYITERQDVEQIVSAVECDRDLVLKILRQVDRNKYKRRQAPPGLRVTSKAFGIGRKMPIVMRWNRTGINVPVQTP